MRNNFWKHLLTGLLVVLSTLALAQNGEIPPRPTDGPVLQAGVSVLSASEESQLKSKLRAYEDTTSTQIAILIVNNLGGRDVAEYGQQVGETWGVGQNGKDNGVMIVVAMEERDWTLQSGYGVEGALPDGVLGEIGRTRMRPQFRNGNFYQGLEDATDEIMARMSGEYSPEPAEELPMWKKMIPLFVILLIVWFFIKYGNKGGGNFTNMNHGGRRNGRYGTPWIFPTGSGSGSFGGGGGGWGGFGGGSFGGGGASGGW
jgi:uncharacterized protein